MKVVFIPGNGGGTTQDNWFPKLKTDLEKKGVEVIAADFPDSVLARKSYWIPFLIDTLKVDKDTILIGHSSGAIASMIIAENHTILGSILVGAYYTNLGMETEKESGYFDHQWNWANIKKNQKWTILFASDDDPWIPIHEPRHIREKLNCQYHEYNNQGHFGGDYFKPDFPELTAALLDKLNL